jgi:NAD/NADP transhydrogenase beta subunit
MSDTARRILLAILLLGAFGITAELLLLAHTEDTTQWIPIALAGATAVVSAVVALRPSAGSIRVFQMVMLLMIVSGGVGMYLHLRANMEFQLEMDATLSGFALFKKSIVAKAPPALAPGSMTQLGLIGLAYTFRHPALGARREI